MDIPISSSMQKIMQADAAASKAAQTRTIAQTDSEKTSAEEFTPTASLRLGKQVDIRGRAERASEAQKAREKGLNLPIKAIEEMAKDFHEGNEELDQQALINLQKEIKKGDTPKVILDKIRGYYKDVSLIDEVLDFLLLTCGPDLHEELTEAKRSLHEQFGREITAGRNIQEAVIEAKGLDTPSSLRDLYRKITNGPQDTPTLFAELANKYPYTKLRAVIAYLLHSVGSELNSGGPSIPHGLLHNLLKEVRSLQAILGLYNFFKGRMPLLKKLLEKEHIEIPPQLTFEALAKQFMSLVDDRYPNPDKIIQSAAKLGINDSISAKIFTFSQERDAVREVAFNLIYRSLEHRESVSNALIGALSLLEDQLDELILKQEQEIQDKF